MIKELRERIDDLDLHRIAYSKQYERDQERIKHLEHALANAKQVAQVAQDLMDYRNKTKRGDL